MLTDKAEILFVCTANTGLARMAEGALWSKLASVGLEDDYRLFSATLPVALRPAALAADRGRDELGDSYVLGGQILSAERVRQADLVLVMSEAERRAILGHFAGVEGKVSLLSETAGATRDIAGVERATRRAFDSLCQDVGGLVEAGFEAILNQAQAAREAVMARVGLSTGTFHYEFAPPSLAYLLLLIRQAGVSTVDWSQDLESDHVYTPAEMDRSVELLESTGLQCESVHGFENTAVHAVTTGEALDRYVAAQGSRVELCARLGGDTVVLHLPGLFWPHLGITLGEALEQTTVALDRLRPLCERLGVRLAVENYREQSSTQRLDFYLGRYPAEFMSFCLDTGHANLVAGEMEQMKAYASRLTVLHLHDNQGVEDDHQPPFFGTVDWAGLMEWLQYIGYGRSLNFELIFDRHLFAGSPVDFVGFGVQRIRQALSTNPALARGLD